VNSILCARAHDDIICNNDDVIVHSSAFTNSVNSITQSAHDLCQLRETNFISDSELCVSAVLVCWKKRESGGKGSIGRKGGDVEVKEVLEEEGEM